MDITQGDGFYLADKVLKTLFVNLALRDVYQVHGVGRSLFLMLTRS